MSIGACSRRLPSSSDSQIELPLQNTVAQLSHYLTTRSERQESVFHSTRYDYEYIGEIGIYERGRSYGLSTVCGIGPARLAS